MLLLRSHSSSELLPGDVDGVADDSCKAGVVGAGNGWVVMRGVGFTYGHQY